MRILKTIIALLVVCDPLHKHGNRLLQIRKLKTIQVLYKKKKPRNVIFILTDDHRYDYMGFTGKVPWLQTPNMDKLAAEGAYLPNTFVTTSLCSPSRASILTGSVLS